VLEVTGAAIDFYNESPLTLAQIYAVVQAGYSQHDNEARPTTDLGNIRPGLAQPVDPRNAVVGIFGATQADDIPAAQSPSIDLDDQNTISPDAGDLFTLWFPGGLGYPSVLQTHPSADPPRHRAGLALELRAGIAVDDTSLPTQHVQPKWPVTQPVLDDGALPEQAVVTIGDADEWTPPVTHPVLSRAAIDGHADELSFVVDEATWEVPRPWLPRAVPQPITESDDVVAVVVTIVDEAGEPVTTTWLVRPVQPPTLDSDELVAVVVSVVDEAGEPVTRTWRVAQPAQPIAAEDVVSVPPAGEPIHFLPTWTKAPPGVSDTNAPAAVRDSNAPAAIQDTDTPASIRDTDAPASPSHTGV
jgi:hypothetical protein